MKRLKRDFLDIEIYDTRLEMGNAAAAAAATSIRALHAKRGEVNIVFAAAPSQNEFLAALCQMDLPWGDINAFHMDEYIGLDGDAPQRFGNFLKHKIFDAKPFKAIYYLQREEASTEELCGYYSALLAVNKPDLILMGIGENGHIAFNDPHVAQFDDPLWVKIVSLDEVCRLQQVNDGCFGSLEEVPTHAITLTIPAMLQAERVFVVVPAATKARAVAATVDGPIATQCPASILRKHPNATLYCDAESAKYIG